MYYQKNLSIDKGSLSWYSLGLPKNLYLTVWITAGIVLFLSVYDIIKWFGPQDYDTWVPMRPATAVCFFISCIALLCTRFNLPVLLRTGIPLLLSATAGIFSLLNFVVEFFKEVSGKELLTGYNKIGLFLDPNLRMPLFVSVSFMLIAVIIILINGRRYNTAHIINIPVAMTSYFFLISFVIGIEPNNLNGIPFSPDTGIATATFCILIFMIAPNSKIMRVFLSGSGILISRQLIIPLIIIPLFFGFIRFTKHQEGLFDSEISDVMIIMIYTTCFIILAWIVARSFTLLDLSRQKADEASVKYNDRLKLLSEVSARLLASEDPQIIVNDLCAKVMKYLDCQVFFNFIYAGETERLHLNAYAGISEDEASKISWLEKGSAICGCVARDAQPIIVGKIQQSDDKRADIVRKFGVRTYASFPLMSQGNVIGTLSFGASNRDFFTEDEISMIRTVADQVAIAMGRMNNERQLRESEDRFRKITESLPTPLSITKTSDGTFMFVNDVYAKMLGCSTNDLIGKKSVNLYNNASEREDVLAMIREKGSLENFQIRIKRADGTYLWVLTSIQPILYNGQAAFLGSSVSIEREKKQQSELRRLNRTLNALGKSSQMMMHSRNEVQLLNDICRIITEDCGYMMVWVGYVRDDADKSVEPVAWYGIDKEYIDKMKLTWADTERGKGPTGIAVRTGKPAIVGDMHTNPSFAPWREDAIKRGFASGIVVPMLTEGRVIGVLSIYSSQPDSFLDDDVKLLTNLADDLSYGIVHLRLTESEKKATQAIKESEERYRMLFETMVEGFAVKELILDGNGKPYDWKFLSVNPAFEKQTGLTSVTGKTARQVMHNLEETWLVNYGKVVHEENSIEFINFSSDLNAWFRISAFPIRNRTFACIVENITSRMLAERELRNTKDYLENLISSTNAPIVVWNPMAEIQLFNGAFEHLTGYRSEEVLGKKIDILFPDDSRDEMNIKIVESFTTNLEAIEIPILTKDRKIRTVLWNSANIYDPDNNSVLSTIAQGNDITERKLAEEEVRKSKEKLDIALESANIGIWSWNFANNSWDWDERISFMLGIKEPPSSYSFSILETYIHDEDIPHVGRAFEKSRKTQTPLDTFFRLKRNGETRYIEVKGSVIFNEGKPVKMSGVCMDITAMKEGTEKAMVHLNEDLLRSNKELEQFAYVASHDLQEPLRMVSSFTQLLASRYKNKLDDEALEFIDFAVDGARRMQRLINDLLHYSRIKTRGKNLIPTDMNEVFRQMLQNLSIKIAEKEAMVKSVPLPVVNADEGQMVQLLQNLVENGIKFSKNKPVIQISYKDETDYHLFSVKDNGIGIEPQYNERIFQIFQRLHLKDEYGGTGIGLAICQRIVDRHGGKIWVASSNGPGTTFNFTIKKS